MNKTIKIILLAVGVIAAVAAVLIFMRTVISPPQNIKQKDQYALSVASHIADFEKVDDKDLIPQFLRLSDLLATYKHECAINAGDYNDYFLSLATSCAPRLAESSFQYFTRNEWSEDEINLICNRIAYMRGLTVNNGTRNVMEALPASNSKFDEILGIVGSYKEAKALSANSGFAGIESARRRLQSAREYRNNEYLKNNLWLMRRLSDLPSRMEATHYAYLQGQVNSLAHYSGYTESQYDALTDNVSNAIDQYRDNASSIYGTSHNVSSLKQQASSYYRQAQSYFETRPKSYSTGFN